MLSSIVTFKPNKVFIWRKIGNILFFVIFFVFLFLSLRIKTPLEILMLCPFSINCHMLNKFQKKKPGTKNIFSIVTLVLSLEHILTLPFCMIKTLDLFPKLTSPLTYSSNSENKFCLPHMWLLHLILRY